MKRVLLCIPVMIAGCVQPAAEVSAYKLGESPTDYSTRIVRDIDSCDDTTCLRSIEQRMRDLQRELENRADGLERPRFQVARFNYYTAVSHQYSTLADVSVLRAQYLNHEVTEKIYTREKKGMRYLLEYQGWTILKSKIKLDQSPSSDLL